ncbi:MAG: hypothetical protein PHD04_03485 [Candidatus Pacebacteria bacterium]|nr:hypothetical protein [Candidatus Paceibacterota bacterium]
MKDEFSLECEICGTYNIQEGVIVGGKIYCWNCIKRPDFTKFNLKKRRKIKA